MTGLEFERPALPRLIYYQDAHHFHAKRLDPPVSLSKLRWPIDELLGTGVDTLAFGLGYGDVYFHESKTGRVVGDQQETWDSFIDWRIMRLVESSRELGIDQLRSVIDHGKADGLRVFPSLKLQSCDRPGSDRCGKLKWESANEVCLLEKDIHHPRYEWCYDYAHPAVRQSKLDLLAEVMEDYAADGIELDFMFVPKYFRSGEEECHSDLMNSFVSDVRRLANEIGARQGRYIAVGARVFHQREANLKLGLDVETWLRDGSVDIVIGQMSEQLLDATSVNVKWLVDAAGSHAGIYVRPPRRIYHEEVGMPTGEMFRAFGQAVSRQGGDGLYLGYLKWPFDRDEYQILREMAHPEVYERKNKRYVLQPRESGLVFEELLDYQGDYPKVERRKEDEITNPPDRNLPVELLEKETARAVFVISDDLESANRDGELRGAVISIRFAELCVEDTIEIRLNDEVLPPEDAEITDQSELWMPLKSRGSPVEASLQMPACWFRYNLGTDILQEGENVLEVEVMAFEKTAGFTRSINGVEIRTQYAEFERPQDFNVRRVAPSN